MCEDDSSSSCSMLCFLDREREREEGRMDRLQKDEGGGLNE